jgi:cytochrome b involved in lipid metabolism
MTKNTKPQLIIDGVEYDVEKLTDQQKALLDHVVDLERKVGSARFNFDQLQVGRDSFFNLLKQSLVDQPAEARGNSRVKNGRNSRTRY